MPASWYSDSTTYTYRTYTVSNGATATTCTIRSEDWRYVSNCNYRSVLEPLPKCEHDSVIAIKRLATFGIDPLRLAPVRKPASAGRARAFRHLPRGKLDRWPSLKEKRAAWGIA